jgi:putative oxidoreductase
MDVDASQTVATAALAQTLLRVACGVIMATHGWLKLTDYPTWHAHVVDMGLPSPELLAPLAVAGELLGGLGLIVGLFTRLAAFGVMCVMAVAIATVHLQKGLLAQNGGFEYPLLILATSLFFLVAGGGPISLDAALHRRSYRRSIERDPRWQRPPYVPEVPPVAARDVLDEPLFDRYGRRVDPDDPRLHRH